MEIFVYNDKNKLLTKFHYKKLHFIPTIQNIGNICSTCNIKNITNSNCDIIRNFKYIITKIILIKKYITVNNN